jgi:hypothetical protein
MLPKELTTLKKALKGKRFYTFSGDDYLCKELEQVDALLERVRTAKNTTEVQDAINETLAVWKPSVPGLTVGTSAPIRDQLQRQP